MSMTCLWLEGSPAVVAKGLAVCNQDFVRKMAYERVVIFWVIVISSKDYLVIKIQRNKMWGGIKSQLSVSQVYALSTQDGEACQGGVLDIHCTCAL